MKSWFGLPSKIRWKLFRQFQSLEQIAEDSHCRHALSLVEPLEWNWQVANLSSDEHSEKLLLSRRSVAPLPSVQCEAVSLMPPPRNGSHKTPRATACISSQPGCGVGCPFCATGRLGYRGNLTASEIAEQVYWVGRQAAQRGRQLRNVVFMGMGEPLHNFQNVSQSLELLTHPALFGIPQRRITVSTVGVPLAMLQLASQFPDVKLALSLHSAVRDQRRQLVPKAITDLEVLHQTVRQLNQLQSFGVWLEVVMLEGVNDSEMHAQQLIAFCEGLRVEVNLIPYNSTNVLQSDSKESVGTPLYRTTSKIKREAFAQLLRAAGIRTSIRTSFGGQTAAACGQLRTSSEQAEIS